MSTEHQQHQRNATYLSLAAAGIAIFISMIGSGVAIVERFQDTNYRNRIALERDKAIASSIRTVLCLARDQALNDVTISRARRERAIHFYVLALQRIHAAPCGSPTIRR